MHVEPHIGDFGCVDNLETGATPRMSIIHETGPISFSQMVENQPDQDFEDYMKSVSVSYNDLE